MKSFQPVKTKSFDSSLTKLLPDDYPKDPPSPFDSLLSDVYYLTGSGINVMEKVYWKVSIRPSASSSSYSS
jgi:hypothetical protein